MILPSLADTTTTARHIGGPMVLPSPSVGAIARVTVKVSLSRMAMWTQELGLLDRSALDGKRPTLDISEQTELPLRTIGGPFGDVTYLPSSKDMVVAAALVDRREPSHVGLAVALTIPAACMEGRVH